MSITPSIVETARIVGSGPTDRDAAGNVYGVVTVKVEYPIGYPGSYAELRPGTRKRIELLIAERLRLFGWQSSIDESWQQDNQGDDTGAVLRYSRPAHRPRMDPAAARIVRPLRLHPDTAAKIDAGARAAGVSAGVYVDRLAQMLNGAYMEISDPEIMPGTTPPVWRAVARPFGLPAIVATGSTAEEAIVAARAAGRFHADNPTDHLPPR